MYTFERFYYFRPYRGKSNYWLNRYGEGAISSHQKATLYTATGAADQRQQLASGQLLARLGARGVPNRNVLGD